MQSGETYQINEAGHSSSNDTANGATTQTYTASGMLVGNGPNPNVVATVQIHLTIDANGIRRAAFEHVNAHCH